MSRSTLAPVHCWIGVPGGLPFRLDTDTLSRKTNGRHEPEDVNMLIPDVLRNVASGAAPTEAQLRAQPDPVSSWLGLGGCRGLAVRTMGPAQPTLRFSLVALKCDVTEPLQRRRTCGPRVDPRPQARRRTGVRTRPRLGRSHQAMAGQRSEQGWLEDIVQTPPRPVHPADVARVDRPEYTGMTNRVDVSVD